MEGIKIQIDGNIAKVVEKPDKITSGTVGMPAEFTFDSQWDGLKKFAVFQAGDVTKTVENPEGVINVPWEVLHVPKVWLSVGAYGINEEGTVVITTIWTNVSLIKCGVMPDDSISQKPTPSFWQTIANFFANLAKKLFVQTVNGVGPDEKGDVSVKQIIEGKMDIEELYPEDGGVLKIYRFYPVLRHTIEGPEYEPDPIPGEPGKLYVDLESKKAYCLKVHVMDDYIDKPERFFEISKSNGVMSVNGKEPDKNGNVDLGNAVFTTINVKDMTASVGTKQIYDIVSRGGHAFARIHTGDDYILFPITYSDPNMAIFYEMGDDEIHYTYVVRGNDVEVKEDILTDLVQSVNGKYPDESGNVELEAGGVKTVNGISPDENGNVEIPIGGGSAESAVLYNAPQELTPEQQTQARANIGAAELAYEVDYRGNILPIGIFNDVYTQSGITITHENGVLTLNGTCTLSTSIDLIPRGTPYATIKAGEVYTNALVYISGEKTGALNLFTDAGFDVYMNGNATTKRQLTPDKEVALTRFSLNCSTGVAFDNFKVAPYLGQNFVDSYAGGEVKLLEAATKKSVAQLEEKINLLPTMYTDEKDRVIPIVQGINADLRLIAFADPHSFDKNKYRKYNDLLSSGCIDSIVGLGDYQSYSTKTRADTLKYITQSLNHAGRTPNCFYAIGNHDIAFTSSNSGEVTQDNVLTKREMYDCACRHLNGAVQYNDEDPYGGYYYVDYTASKIRMVVLNTSDIYEADGSLAYKYTESVMIQQPQVTWLVEKALDFSGKTGWSVLVCCHSAFIRTMLTDILSAVKSGASLNKTWTFDRRLEDGADSVTIAATKDFSGQGAVDVIGVLYGHDHHDIITVTSGIPFIGFISDNGKLDDYYVAKVNGLTAGGYCFTAKNGSKFGFTLTEDIADASVFGYNAYLMGLGNTTIRFQNADGATVKEARAKTADYTDGMTEITGFVQERTPGTIAEESCFIVNIDKDTREIRIVPYGVGENRVISY